MTVPGHSCVCSKAKRKRGRDESGGRNETPRFFLVTRDPWWRPVKLRGELIGDDVGEQCYLVSAERVPATNCFAISFHAAVSPIEEI